MCAKKALSIRGGREGGEGVGVQARIALIVNFTFRVSPVFARANAMEYIVGWEPGWVYALGAELLLSVLYHCSCWQRLFLVVGTPR